MNSAAVRVRREDGVISVILALTMALFIVLLAVVLDLGQLQGARSSLAGATSSAASRAANVLARNGCVDFDLARAAASAALQENAATASIDVFEVRYGVVTVTSVSDCTLVLTDQNVGQVEVRTTDSRTPVFSAAFTSAGLTTSAATKAEWGYVTGMAGGLRPLSLCTSHPAFEDYQQYLSEQAAFKAGLGPAPAASLLDPFDIEVDGFIGYADPPVLPATVATVVAGFCRDADTPALDPDPEESGVPGRFGDLVNVDFSDSDPSAATLSSWIRDGAPFLVVLDDPTTVLVDESDCGESTVPVLGHCEGVRQSDSTDQLSDFAPIVGTIITIALHDEPRCHNNNGSIGHCTPGSRDHRAYPLSGFARVEVLCARNTAYNPSQPLPADPDAASPTVPSSVPTVPPECVGLSKVARDTNPGDDVMVRLRFIVDDTIGEGNLSATPSTLIGSDGFVGVSVCSVDGDDNCRF